MINSFLLSALFTGNAHAEDISGADTSYIGATILEEGIAHRASDIDLVYLNGYGFPVWRGGPMHWAGAVGLDVVADGVRRYSGKSDLGHWKLSRLLGELAEDGASFESYDAGNQSKGS